MYQLSENAVSTITIDISSIYPNYAELTVSNFICDIYSYNVSATGSLKESGVYEYSSQNFSRSNVINKSYNPTTGVFTASIAVSSGQGWSATQYLATSSGYYYYRGTFDLSAKATFIPYLVVK